MVTITLRARLQVPDVTTATVVAAAACHSAHLHQCMVTRLPAAGRLMDGLLLPLVCTQCSSRSSWWSWWPMSAVLLMLLLSQQSTDLEQSTNQPMVGCFMSLCHDYKLVGQCLCQAYIRCERGSLGLCCQTTTGTTAVV